MSGQFSVAVRNARADAIEVVTGATAHLKIYSGSPPASCATAPSGTLLCDITLPADYFADAAAGVKSMSGTWAGTGAAAGSAGYFRITDTAGTNAHVQGTVTATGGGGDMTVDNVSIASGQAVTVTGFTITEGNA